MFWLLNKQQKERNNASSKSWAKMIVSTHLQYMVVTNVANIDF